MEFQCLKKDRDLPKSRCLLCLHPFIDSNGVPRVAGREQNSMLMNARKHPFIVHGNHIITKLLIQSEQLSLLHASPTLVYSSLSYRFYTLHVAGCKNIRFIIRSCTVHCCKETKSQPQLTAWDSVRDSWLGLRLSCLDQT